MLSVHDIEILRRSAAMAPLSKADVERLLLDAHQLVVERERIAAVLAELPMSVTALRTALNELHQIVS